MLIDLTDYDSKKLELEIKRYEKAISETKGIISNLEFNKVKFELDLIEHGVTEEDVKKYVTDFMESSDNPQKDLILLHEELNELLESDKDYVIEDLDKLIGYAFISISIINLEIEDYQESISVLREKLLELQKQQLELQERKIDEIATERKYKELLKDEN